MRWTIWHRRSKCQNCGARIPVPGEGLTMRCQYCGVEVPVPDVERRKKKQASTATEQRVEPRKQRAAGPTRRGSVLRGLLRFLVLLALIGAVLYFTGTSDYLTEPLFGDPGADRYASAVESLQKERFVRVTPERVERYFSSTKLYLEVQPDVHHALVLASGQPIKKVMLSDPTGRIELKRGALRYQETLRFVPRMDGVYAAKVVLDRPGRYIWALHRGPMAKEELPKPVSKRATTRRRRRRTRRRSVRHRRSGARAPSPVLEPLPPTVPVTAPSPPAGKEEDEDLRRAIKASEIQPGEEDM